MANNDVEGILCPFGCDYKIDDGDDYQIMMLHVQTHHPEDGDQEPSPFVVKDDSTLPSDKEEDGVNLLESEDYVYCGCGEALLLTELELHAEMHEQEGDVDQENEEASSRSGKRLKLDPETEKRGTSFDTKLSYALRNLDDVDGKEEGSEKEKEGRNSKSTWREILNMPASVAGGSPKKGKKRLGKSDLGPHWNEKQMPAWLVKLLESDGKMETLNQLGADGKMRRVKMCPNMAPGVVPVIAQLLKQDRSVAYGYLCDPAVKHVSKLKKEGGFCGYRNIQMLSSWIIGAESQGHEILNEKIPTIFEIQEHIEGGWDMGINSQGRVETGGIRGTRKYIGTPDAQAMLCGLGISCAAESYKPNKEKSKKAAYDLLFTGIEQHFTNGCSDYDAKVRCTTVPPIYFQHPGHSMTIIGIEKSTNGSRNLLVFDPMFHDAPQILSFVDKSPTQIRHKRPQDLLKAYRRDARYLRRYNEFEILRLTPPKEVSITTAVVT